jgi:hypothetical protein
MLLFIQVLLYFVLYLTITIQNHQSSNQYPNS